MRLIDSSSMLTPATLESAVCVLSRATDLYCSSSAADLRAIEPANFLYADGDALFAHGHKRLQGGGP